ncbi:HtaA domain-containing protein [Nocardioides sp. AE5]|uniref:HtaA domain-containing protein n=1 Tax=Nocardioides sp. AE5 TaxID=2962573 RepID=UPI002882BBA8|nr:HtaA domain-containing protein [Nocardioides sp. AE5]MDT0201937.1 HtaA domain-containing protein [Nocardioides sp. AE5]
MDSHASPAWWRRFAAALSAVALTLAGLALMAPAHAAGGWETTATVTGASEADGLTVEINGTNYTNLPESTSAGPSMGVYVALVPTTATYADINPPATPPASDWVMSLPGDAFTKSLTAPTSSLSADKDYKVVVWRAHGDLTEGTFIDEAPVNLTDEQKEALFPGSTAPDLETTARVTGASQADGLSIEVKGTGYLDLPTPTSDRAGGIYAALIPADGTFQDLNDRAYLAVAAVSTITDGVFTATVNAAAAKLSSDDVAYKIVTWSAHGNITEDTFIDEVPVTLTDDQVEALFPAPAKELTTTATVTGASEADGLTVKVDGTGYTDLPPSTSGMAGGIYAALVPAGASQADISNRSAILDVAAIRSLPDGGFTATLNATPDQLDPNTSYEVITWVAHGNLTDATHLATVAITLTDAQRAVLFPGSAEETDELDTTATVTGADATDGLTVKVDGTGYSDLPKASSGKDAVGIYVALRDTSISDEELNADTELAAKVNFLFGRMAITNGTFSTDVIATVDKLDKDADYEIVVWAAHGNLTADTHLATVAITLTDAQKDALFGTEDGDGDEDGDTPGTSGPKVTVSSSQITAGATLTIRGSGFKPGEKVAATVHSEPVSLGTKAANSAGNVVFTWKVPTDFEVGRHRVELVAASGTATLNFTVAAAAPTVTCRMETVPATAGTPHLTWGVKSSFVTYMEGGVAKGSISVSNGAARSGNAFTWGAGSGSLSSSGRGTVSFPGTVHFTGHAGALKTRLSNLRVVSSGGGNGTMVADVVSQDMDGNNTGGNNITIADLKFSNASSSGAKASATLTAAGARAFSNFYNAGDPLDALTVSFSGAKAASTQEVCYDADGNRVNPDGSEFTGEGALNANLGGHALGQGTSAGGLELIGAGLLMAVLLMVRRRFSTL